jgi:hypothetical protein
MKAWKIAIAAAAVALFSTMSTSAQDKEITFCWAAWDPCQRAGRTLQGFYRQDRHQDEIRVPLPWTVYLSFTTYCANRRPIRWIGAPITSAS